MEERLQKIIARAGLASRRAAEEMILNGRISINNKIVRQLGSKADVEQDEIRLDGLLISVDVEKCYLMLNKPAGYVTTLNDPQARPIVLDLLPGNLGRLFPVGRLDYDSQGLILMTNDGNFAQQLSHPRFGISKKYKVKVKGKLTKEDFRGLVTGIKLEDGIFIPETLEVSRFNEKSTWLTVTLRSGRNRIIRRAFAAIGYEVVELIRISIGGLELGNLKSGDFRLLSAPEVRNLLSTYKRG